MPPAGADSGLLTRLPTGSDAAPRAAADRAGGPGGPGVRAASYALFRQAGHAYLLPATSVLGVVGAEHVRPLPAPVAGWAGTLTVPRRDGAGGEAAVPVLDATALLGHGGAAGAVLLLRTASGPLGLAVQQVDRVHGLPGAARPARRRARPGRGARHGGRRMAAAGSGSSRCRTPGGRRPGSRAAGCSHGRWPGRPKQWGRPTVTRRARRRAGWDVRRGKRRCRLPARRKLASRCLVIAERAASDRSTNLALPLRLIRGVSRLPTIRPSPPGAPGVVGYGAWGERVLPVVDPRALGVATDGPAPAYAVLVVLEGPGVDVPLSALPLTSTVGIALLVAGVRGIQRLEQVDGSWPADAAFPLALGKTPAGRADAIAVGATDPAG